MTHDTQDPMTLAQFEGLLNRRHSCRGFLDQPVPRDTIERILEAAQRTASWSNVQPWWIHIASGPVLDAIRADLQARIDAGAKAAPELDWPREIRGVHRERKRACGWGLYEAVGIAKGDRVASAAFTRENFRCFGAPHLVVVCSVEAQGTHGVMDSGAWVSNFMLAAESAGVATVAQAALASWPDVMRKHLDIDPDHQVICGIAFGYEDPANPANHFRTDRAPIDEVVRWAGFDDRRA